MNTLVFNNPGEIDIRGACIAGLSAKESNSPIGYFGTGLKYSIACILRWGGEITIYSGLSKYIFHTGTIDFRGSEFKVVYMNNQPLGFTTEYGKNWKPWQVFRELYANARDEAGTVRLIPFDVDSLAEGETTILVTGVPDLIECFYQQDEIILPANKQFCQRSSKVEFDKQPAFGIYYRGVRVHEQACCFTWNFLESLDLTEDRTIRSIIHLSGRFDNFIEQELHDIEILMQLLEMKYAESDPRITRTSEKHGKPIQLQERPAEAMLMDWYTTPIRAWDNHSHEFQQACIRLYQRDPTTFGKLRSYVKSIDSKLIEEKQYCMSSRELLMFDKAKELVALFGFENEINQLPILVQELGGQTLGLYEHGTIYLSPKLFDQGTKQLTATLYEECYHHRTQNKDCTYNMQSDLFNIIISLNEELHKVIC